jgi:hypothetical protein
MKKHIALFFLLVAIPAFTKAASKNQSLKQIKLSKDIQVIDGNSIKNGSFRIRLYGIDAPVVLGKVGKLQLVKIQPTQSVTDSVEPNLTYEEVTNHAKLRGGMYWVVTKVKEVSSEIYNIVEADIL